MKQVVFRPDASLLKQIQARVNNEYTTEHQVASRDLKRYYSIIQYSLWEIELTENEVRLIIDSTNGTLFDNFTIRLIVANIEDGIYIERLDLKHNVDGVKLLSKLKNASIGYYYSLVDAIEKYWAINDGKDDKEKFIDLGLIRENKPSATT